MPAEQLEKFMNEYGDALFRMCYLYLKDYQLAQDAVQETFIKAMKAYDSFEHRSSEKTWLIRIAINCCKNIMRSRWFQLRKNDTGDFREDYLRKQEKTDMDPIDHLLEKNSISSAVMKLSTNDRQMIVLYYYQGLSAKEIAAVTGKTENAIAQRLNRARGRMKKILTEAGYGEE